MLPPIEESVVQFVTHYRTLTPEQQAAQAGEVRRLQACLEKALPEKLEFALLWGIKLGGECQDPQWVQRLVGQAYDIARSLKDEQRLYDMQDIFDSFLAQSAASLGHSGGDPTGVPGQLTSELSS